MKAFPMMSHSAARHCAEYGCGEEGASYQGSESGTTWVIGQHWRDKIYKNTKYKNKKIQIQIQNGKHTTKQEYKI